jgi:DNA-directed RNA polymerase specialized sigma24 family protein
VNSVHVPKQEVLRKEPRFTQLAFDRLLEWLDDGVDSHGERYLEIRRRLVSYFDRQNRPRADELADETLNRVARTLARTGRIETRPPARYCYVVARFVLLEDFRRERIHATFTEPETPDASRQRSVADPDDGRSTQEQRVERVDRCLHGLKAEQRELVVEYYRDPRRPAVERRRNLAKRLGITMDVLGTRAARIREAITTCVETSRGGRRQL